jgi:hypothetical protein
MHQQDNLTKIYNLEIVDGDYVYQTKSIKAQSKDEAETMIREAFLHLISKDSEIFVLSEDIIH